MARTFAVAVLFLGLGLSAVARADKAAAVPPATRHQVQQAVERSIVYLRAESAAWLKQRKCAACHHAAMPLWSLSEAERQGYAIDKKFVAETTEATLGSREKMIASKLISGPKDPPDPRPIGRGVQMGTVFMAAVAPALPALQAGQKQSLKSIVDEIVKKQTKDGSWEFFLSRPPINETQLTDAVWIIMALQCDTGSAASPAQRAALDKATAWLAAARLPDTYQSKVLKLLLAIRAGKARDQIRATGDELLALQRADGGWRQIPEMTSDAFATGQTLYVLSLAGYTAERPEIQRAVNFLVATQKPDGSWPMTSRATPDGRPGHAKLLTPITCAAGAWATLGLARLVPAPPK
jgi:hypothetical protein